ncbi:MAG: GIY-YIG nuclease family protein [Patescibacteria group bacterium]|jgi:hypothetical protein
MADPFTIRIFVPEGNPESVRIIDRLSSTGIFFAFPRAKWGDLRHRQELNQAGIYILSGYADPEDELPTIYVGQADVVRNRIDQHIKNKDFWDKAVIFVSANKMNATHARWLEYALVKRAVEANRSKLENGNSPQEPSISESEKADMKVFLREIYQTLPLVGMNVFEIPKTVAQPQTQKQQKNEKNTIIVPAQEDGFKRVFLGENAWWAVRISGGMLEKIKYIAAYQTAPVSAITHVAPVNRIEPYGEEGKYKLIFSEPANKLKRPIPFGNSPQGLMQGPKYTIFNKLKTAQKIADLLN